MTIFDSILLFILVLLIVCAIVWRQKVINRLKDVSMQVDICRAYMIFKPICQLRNVCDSYLIYKERADNLELHLEDNIEASAVYTSLRYSFVVSMEEWDSLFLRLDDIKVLMKEEEIEVVNQTIIMLSKLKISMMNNVKTSSYEEYIEFESNDNVKKALNDYSVKLSKIVDILK